MAGPSFVALDVETANRSAGSICAVGIAIVRDGELTKTLSWLCRPPQGLDHFDGFNTAIHGIHAKDVKTQPQFADVWETAMQQIGTLPVVAHNAGFDTRALREACDASTIAWPTFDYGCTLVFSRRCLDLPSYRLPLVSAELGVPLDDHHEARSDATAAATITLKLAARYNVDTLDTLAQTLEVSLGHLSPSGWRGCTRRRPSRTKDSLPSFKSSGLTTPDINQNADPMHPLYGQTVAFTGGLTSMQRQQAFEAVAALGGSPAKSVTRTTTRVVIGDGFRGDSIDEFHTAKAQKALALRGKGMKIEILSEPEFLTLIAAEVSHGGPQR